MAEDAAFDLTVDREAAELRAALARWLMFDTSTAACADEHARQVTAVNVPTRDPARHAEHRQFFASAAAGRRS